MSFKTQPNLRRAERSEVLYIRKKLLFWILSPLVLTGIITVGTVYYYVSKTITQNIFDQLEMAADEVYGHVDMFIQAKRNRIVDFSSDGFIKICTEKITHRMDIDSYTFKLNRHLIINKKSVDEKNILEVFVVDLDGNIISSTENSHIGQDVSDKAFFSKVKERLFYINDLHYSPEFKQNTFEVAGLFKVNEGMRPIGIIVIRYNDRSLKGITRSGIPEELGDVKRLEGLGETGEIYIVNRDKLMITGSRVVRDAVFNQVVETEGVKAAFENGKGMVGVYPGYRGISILGISRYIEEMGWVVLAEKEVTEAFEPIRHLRTITITIMVAGIIIVTIITIFLFAGITKSIRKLVEGTRRIAKGDLDFRIVTKSKDEIGSLANSLNDMTSQIGESKRQLQDYALNLEKKVDDRTKELIKLNNAIRRGKEYTEDLIETAQDVIISIYEDGIINVWNKAAEKVFRYSKSEIIGQPITTIIPEKYKNQHQEGIKRFLKTHKPVIIGKTIEISGLTKEGTEIPIEMSLSCQKIENKRYTFTAIIRDITEKKKNDAERKRLLDELTYKNKEMEQIIYVTSHDLRSPLLNIQGFSRELVKDIEQVRQKLNENTTSSAVKEKLSETLEEDIPDALKFILASSSKMDALLSGLLRLSRMGRVVLAIKQLNMNKLISNVIEAHEYKIKEEKVKVQVGELPSCKGDNEQIGQVFSNLMDNALKYLDSDKEGIIRISGRKKNGHIVYCLEDNGIGIAERHQDKVFEIFHRLNPGNSVAGEGLGLTIIRKILDRHGGKIWVESEPGKGSRFFVSLPE